MKKYFIFLIFIGLTVSCAHNSQSPQQSSFRNPSSDAETFPVNYELIKKMIKNGKVGNCTVTLEPIDGNKIRLIITQHGFVYYSQNAKDYLTGPTFSKSVVADLSKSFGVNTYLNDDYAGTIQLYGNDSDSTLMIFDIRTKSFYRLIDFPKKGSQMDCMTAVRPN